MRRLIAIPLAGLLLVPAAFAAEPDKGTVSASSPKVTWKGHLEHPYADHLVYNYEGTAGGSGQVPCQEPSCDTFTLDVADQADLTIVTQSEQTPDISLRIQAPDGTWTYYDGWSDGAKPTTVKIKKAAKGTYVINVVARIFGTNNPTAVDDTADYTGTATLAVAPAPAAIPPSLPAPPPAAAAAPAPAPKAAAKKPSCRAKAKKIKNAKKRKKALRRCAKTKRK